MVFDKESLDKLRKDTKKALQAVEEENHVLIELGKIVYSSHQCELKLMVYRKDEEVDGQRMEFEALAPSYGFKPEDYMQEFVYKGIMYQFCGFNSRARTNCCLFTKVGSQEKYSCSAGSMKEMLRNSVN